MYEIELKLVEEIKDGVWNARRGDQRPCRDNSQADNAACTNYVLEQGFDEKSSERLELDGQQLWCDPPTPPTDVALQHFPTLRRQV